MRWIIISSILLLTFIICSHAQDKNFQETDSILQLDIPDFDKYEFLRKLGVRRKNYSQYPAALRPLRKAAEGFLKIDSTASYARSLNNIGTVYWYLEERGFAYDYLYQSKRINDSISSPLGLFLNTINLGNFKYKDHDFEEANKNYLEALKHSKQLYDTAKLGLINKNLGVLYSYKDDNNSYYDPKSAYDYYDRSMDLYLAVGDSIGYFTLFQNLGYLMESTSKYEEAINYYEKGLNLSRKLNFIYPEIDLLNNIGNVLFNQNKIQDALSTYGEALVLAEKIQSKEQIKFLNKNLSKCHMALGNDNAAVRNLLVYDVYKDSIYDKAKSRQISELQTKYETEKKEQELELRTAELELKTTEVELSTAENRTLMTTLLVAVGFTIIVIVIFQLRQKTLRTLREREADLRIKEQELHQQQVDQMVREQELKSINAMLEGEEKERKRIAEDLHDRVGSMLSAMKLQTDSSDAKMTGLLDETVEEVRRISHNLETKVLNRFGLVAALEDLAQKINASEKINFEIQHLDLSERLDNKVEIHSYRIVQELVSNALKHSQATEIVTQVNRIDNQLIITVEDNGIGFNSLETREKATGMGLKNVMSRANELNGNFNVDSDKGNGTTITVDFPI